MNGPDNSEDQKNLILAIVLSALVLMIFQFMQPPPVEQMPDNQGGTTGTQTPQKQVAQPGEVVKTPSTKSAAAVPAVDIEAKVIANLTSDALQTVELSNVDGQLRRWTLLEDQYGVREQGDATKSRPFDFVKPQQSSDETLSSRFLPPTIDLTVDGSVLRGEFRSIESTGKNEAVLELVDSARQIKVIKKYTLSATTYAIKVDVSVENLMTQARQYGLSSELAALQNNAEAEPSMFMPPLNLFNSLCKRADDFERLPAADIIDNVNDGEPELNQFADGLQWAGMDNRYFMTAILAAPNEIKSCSAAVASPATAGIPAGYSRSATRVELEPGVLSAAGTAGAAVTRSFQFYGGPKKLSDLNAMQPALGDAIDFGIFSVICVPMLWLMRFSFEYIPNWGIAIIILTVLVKLLTLPLTIKQYKSMAAMKKIQPLMKSLQEKYSDDKVRMQQELMKLYREHQVNPLAGCLPMVMMMPIYFALYRTIYSAVELYQANFGGWLTDLSQQDPYYVTPVLLGLLMIIQFRLNPSAGDQAQTKILMWVMPVMFTAMMLFLPSGLVLYILVNTVLGIAQQWYSYQQQEDIVPKKKARSRS